MSYYNLLFPTYPSQFIPKNVLKNWENYIDYNVIQTELLQYSIGRFTWEMPDYIPPYIPETYLLTRGNFAIFRDKNVPKKFVIASGSGSGRYTANGWFERYTGTTLDGETYEGKVGEDCIIVLNDFFGLPDNALFTYSNILNSLDSCLKANIKLSKNSRAWAVDSDSLKENITKAYRNLNEGDLFVFCADKSDIRKNDIFDNDPENHITPLELTDVKDSDKLQYICRTWDDIFTRALMFRGIDVKSVNKAAQVSTTEINKSSSAAAVPYENAYNLRKWCLDKQQEVFGAVPFKVHKNPAYMTIEDVKENTEIEVENPVKNVESEGESNE